jgi:hypothetical protein
VDCAIRVRVLAPDAATMRAAVTAAADELRAWFADEGVQAAVDVIT